LAAELAFVAPSDTGSALVELATEGAMALAGGTSTVLLLKSRLVHPSKLVFLSRVAGLGGIDLLPGGGMRVGANVRVGELARSEVVRREAPALARAAASVGNPRVRAVATVAGALAHADPRQDLPPVLLALGASAVLESLSGRREVPLDGFFFGLMETALEPGELITEVRLPPGRGRRLAYARYAPGSEDDYPTVGVAAALTMGDEVVQRAAVALGGAGAGAGARPRRHPRRHPTGGGRAGGGGRGGPGSGQPHLRPAGVRRLQAGHGRRVHETGDRVLPHRPRPVTSGLGTPREWRGRVWREGCAF
jgi:carbon-monoxide dehydrogenase medium subunit